MYLCIYTQSHVHGLASDTYCAYLVFTHILKCIQWQVTPIVPIYTQSYVHTMASDTYCAYLHTYICAYTGK